jgi:hypothetical protein
VAGIAYVGRLLGHERQHLERHGWQYVGEVAPFERRVGADLAVDAIRNRHRLDVDVVADQVAIQRANRIAVLQESPGRGPRIRGMIAADDFKRRQLHRRNVEPRFVGHDLHRFGIEHGAGQRDVERLANGDRTGAGLPPAADRFNLRLRKNGHREPEARYAH